jgi:hypothetical protein
MQNVVKLAHFISALHDPWCHFISSFLRVSLAEYLLVLRVLFPLVAGCDVSWLLQSWLAPALVAECNHGHDPSYLSCL